MKIYKILAFLSILATVLTATYMHDRAHRYDIVAVGSGGTGGSQDATGDTGDIRAFLIDHQSGRVWFGEGDTFIPSIRLSCADRGEIDTDSGCKQPK
jgi:hypothetical protein